MLHFYLLVTFWKHKYGNLHPHTSFCLEIINMQYLLSRSSSIFCSRTQELVMWLLCMLCSHSFSHWKCCYLQAVCVTLLSVCCQAATIERRSMPSSGYITHTVSAPSLHGKTVRPHVEPQIKRVISTWRILLWHWLQFLVLGSLTGLDWKWCNMGWIKQSKWTS